jgi:hypothetical protein
VGLLEWIRSLREGEEEREGLEKEGGGLERGERGGEGEEGVVVTPRSPRLRKRGSNRGNGVSAAVEAGGGGGGAAALEGRNVDLSTIAGSGGDAEEEEEGHDRVFSPAQQLHLQRSTTASGNLGTRTLGGGGGFLHRRVSSMGMMGRPHGAASVDGSVAGTSTATTRKKRFGTLRKIFGMHD